MPPASPSPPHPRHRLWRGLLIAGLGSLMAGVALLVLVVAWYGPQLPSLEPVTTYQPRQPLQVFTADGVEIGQFGAERRQFVAIDKIPPLLQNAVLASVDRSILACSTCSASQWPSRWPMRRARRSSSRRAAASR